MPGLPAVMLISQTGFGGSERQLFYLLKHSEREIFDYHVIVLNPSRGPTYDEKIRNLGVKLWRLPASCTGRLQRIISIYRLLRNINPVIVHSWSFHNNPYVALVGWLAGVPVRIGSQRGTSLSPTQQRMQSVFRWLCYRSVSRQVVNSSFAADEMLAMGCSDNRVHIVYNGVELPDLSLDPVVDLSSFGIDSSHRIVGTVGNLRRNKNHRMFIECMARILPHFPDVHCLIVGKSVPDEPSLREELEALIAQLGLSDRIHLTGGRKDVLGLMRRMSLFCLTSHSEGTPNVILEAMAAACPVVATDAGGVSEIIKQGENGFLVNVSNVDDMAHLVTELLRNAKLRRRIGTAGRVTVEERFSYRRMALEMEQVYLNALDAESPQMAILQDW